MKNLLLALLMIVFISAEAQTDRRLRGIEKELEDILEVTKAAGFAIAIVEKNEIVYARGFGYRDYENKIPMDANTLLAIGSSTKAFTSAVLGQLRDEGKLDFNDSPIEYIPELRFFNADLNNNIDIRDLMTHQTGIPRHDYSWYLFPTFNRDSLIQRIAHHEPFTGLRRQWYYNNFMFLTQGVIAERITGKSWEDNIRERFFQPLGMERSNLSIAELEKSTNAAIGYELYKDSVIRKRDYYKIAAMAPAGSINSSVNEIGNWLKVWINNGKFNGEEILSANYVREAMSSHSVIGAAIPDADNPDMFLANYGYGWMISSYKGHYRVEHGGNIDGFSASVAFYPTDSLGIVVLANQNGSSVPSLARNTAADRMLETRKMDWSKYFTDQQEKNRQAQENIEQESTAVANTSPSHVLNDYTGNYYHPGYGRFEITKESDSLFANFKLMKMYLKHEHYDIFEPFEVTDEGIDTTDTGPLRLNFLTNNDGSIGSVRMKIEGALDHPIEFEHEPSEMTLTDDILEKYVGVYELQPGFDITITLEDGHLMSQATGQSKVELFAESETKFFLKVVEAQVEFVEEEDGTYSMILYQAGRKIPARRK